MSNTQEQTEQAVKRVYHDIPTANLKSMANVSGAKRISGDSYDVIRQAVRSLLMTILASSIVAMRDRKKEGSVRLMVKDLRAALTSQRVDTSQYEEKYGLIQTEEPEKKKKRRKPRRKASEEPKPKKAAPKKKQTKKKTTAKKTKARK